MAWKRQAAQNVLERAINIAPGNELTIDLLPEEIMRAPKAVSYIQEDSFDLKDIERKMIENMIRTHISKSEIAKNEYVQEHIIPETGQFGVEPH